MTNPIVIGDCTLYLGDCLEVMKTLPDKSMDAVITDPPYNMGQHSTGNIKFVGRKDINNDIAEWDKVELIPSDLVDEFKRILKSRGNIFAFCDYTTIGKWHEAFDKEFDTFQFMVWHKTNPTPKIFRAGFLNSCELVVCMWNKSHTWNFGNQKDMHNFIETPICGGRERLKGRYYHPTQKPIKVLIHILKIATNSGDTVFDPFMGVGSTGIAALRLGRKFVGIEINETYFEGAAKRIRGEQEQVRLPIDT